MAGVGAKNPVGTSIRMFTPMREYRRGTLGSLRDEINFNSIVAAAILLAGQPSQATHLGG
jgi:hypothetical protein